MLDETEKITGEQKLSDPVYGMSVTKNSELLYELNQGDAQVGV